MTRRQRNARQALAVALGTAALLAGCGGEGSQAPYGGGAPGAPTIEVTTELWSGWSEEDDAPRPTTGTLVPEAGEEHETGCAGYGGPSNVTFTVAAVTGDAVAITFNRTLSLSDDGGINLNDTLDSYLLSAGETVELATPTTDAGCIFTLDAS